MKKVLRIIAYTIVSFSTVLIGLFVYFSKPYIIEIDVVRTTGKLETIRASWGRACEKDFLAEEGSGFGDGCRGGVARCTSNLRARSGL